MMIFALLLLAQEHDYDIAKNDDRKDTLNYRKNLPSFHKLFMLINIEFIVRFRPGKSFHFSFFASNNCVDYADAD